MTYRQNIVWHDPVTLYSNIIASGEAAVKAHTNLGSYYTQQGDFQKASAEYAIAVQNSGDTVAGLQHDMGVNLMMANGGALNDEALTHLRRALVINPDYFPTLKLLADYYAAEGKSAEAAPYQSHVDALRRHYKTISDTQPLQP